MHQYTTPAVTAVKTLAKDYGAHLLRVRADKTPLERPGWAYRATPLVDLLEHVDTGGLLGLTPESVGLAALDVDQGDPEAVAHYFPPVVSIASRTPGRAHCYYRSGRAIPQRRWRFGACSGEIRSRRGGFLILWNAAALLDGLERGGGVDFETDVLPRLDLSRPAKTLKTAATAVPCPASPATESCRGLILDGLIAARTAGLGGNDLMAAAWHLYAALDHPGHLSFSEVSRMVAWARLHSWDTTSQRVKALVGGAARREQNAERDGKIAVMLRDGGSLRSTAAAFGPKRGRNPTSEGAARSPSTPPPEDIRRLVAHLSPRNR